MDKYTAPKGDTFRPNPSPFIKTVAFWEKRHCVLWTMWLESHNYPKECIKPASATAGATIDTTNFRKNHPDNQRVKCQVRWVSPAA